MLSRATPRIIVSHGLMRRSDGILALSAPFHTPNEYKAKFSAPWQNGNSESFGLEGRCTDFWGGPGDLHCEACATITSSTSGGLTIAR
jgi:hypothetical protein